MSAQKDLDCTFFEKLSQFLQSQIKLNVWTQKSFYSNLPMCMSHSKNRFAGERSVPEFVCLLFVTHLIWCLFLH